MISINDDVIFFNGWAHEHGVIVEIETVNKSNKHKHSAAFKSGEKAYTVYQPGMGFRFVDIRRNAIIKKIEAKHESKS